MKGPRYMKNILALVLQGLYTRAVPIPKMPYNCIISFKFKTSISLIHMHPVGNLFLDILLILHKIS